MPVGTKETTLTALAAVPTARLPIGRRYVARNGDTVAKIAKRFGVPADELAAVNGLPAGAAIKRGRALEIPEREPRVSSATRPAGKPKSAAGKVEPVAEAKYRVKGGDTLYGIARRHGTTVDELSAANRLGPDSTIKPGDKLTIPSKSR